MKSINKLVTELKDEELLKFLEETPVTPKEEYTSDYLNNVLEFIIKYNLRRGRNEVSCRILYEVYRKSTLNPVKKTVFNLHMLKFFDCKEVKKKKYYRINKNAFTMANESYNLMKRPNKTKSKEWSKHFNEFMEYYNISQGSYFIKVKFLYELYTKWIRKDDYTRNNLLSIKQFTKFCEIHFKSKVSYETQFFGLNRRILKHFDKDVLRKIMRNRRDFNEEENNKKPE